MRSSSLDGEDWYEDYLAKKEAARIAAEATPDAFLRIAKDRPLQKVSNGRYLCRWCGAEVPKGRRRYYCSDACVEEWKIRRSPSWARYRVFGRDKGVCAVCQMDTVAFARALNDARIEENSKVGQAVAAWFGLPYTTLRTRTDLVFGRDARVLYVQILWTGDTALWEMDHLVPVVEGGGSCGLDGLRTLCWWCHQDESAALARRRQRKQQQLKLPMPERRERLGRYV